MSSSNRPGLIHLHPDMAFKRSLSVAVGHSLERCMQCGTCSAACALSPGDAPFPRKEMARAALGMRAALLVDPDVWLCHACNDCSRSCPRRARPGDVLAAIRRACILHFSLPGFAARWLGRPGPRLLLLAAHAAVLGLLVRYRGPLEELLDIDHSFNDPIVFSHSPFMPHWLLILFFSVVVGAALVTMTLGVARFWRAMSAQTAASGDRVSRSIRSSLMLAAADIALHRRFDRCERGPSRHMSHFLVFFGFLALGVVSSWIVAGGWNLAATPGLVYPFAFTSPWKILANLGGLALLAGCLMMMAARREKDWELGRSTYFDWELLIVLLLILLTGFATEGLHYLRLDPHRHVMYLVHLLSVTYLLMSLPFSKLAHAVYRTAAMVFAARIGRDVGLRGGGGRDE